MKTEVVSNSKSSLDKIISTIGDLPASPAVVSVVMGLTSNLDSNVQEISKVLSSDQTLTAKVLMLSNSSFYGRPKEVMTLDEAIPILGFFAVRSMVIATSAQTMYSSGGEDNPREWLWRHSLSTAVAARQIAGDLKHPTREEIFIAALLHDIGKLVLMQKLPEQYQHVIEAVGRGDGSFLTIENEQFGFNHCDVAEVLLEQWSFPNRLIEAIREHHRPVEIVEEEPPPIAYMIQLSNYLAKKIENRFGEIDIEPSVILETAQSIGLRTDRLEELTEEIREHYQAEINILEG